MHISVGVITEYGTIDEVKKLLKPYDADSFNASYISRTKEEFVTEKRNEYNRYLISQDYLEYKKTGKTDESQKRIFKNLEAALQMGDNDFLRYVKKVEKLSKRYFDKDDNFLYLYNSQEAFDSWTVGGRYHNFLRLLDGSRDCVGLCSRINWKAEDAKLKLILDIWKHIVEKQLPYDSIGNQFHLKTKEDLLGIYKNKAEFYKAHSLNIPQCILTPDGEWEENILSRKDDLLAPTKEDIEQLNKILTQYANYYMVVVDCHY